MDKIIMSDMRFFGYHGALREENVLGQKFTVDAELYLDTRPAGQTDNLTLSVSYADVYADIKDIVEGKPFQLIEALAEKIAATILENYSLINEVMVRIKKPEAPVNAIFEYFGVEIRRSRQ